MAGLAASCSSSEGAPSAEATGPPSTTVAPTVVTTVAAPAATTAPPPTPSTALAVDAASVLAGSLASSGANYRYASVVSLGEQPVTNISGVVDQGSVAAEITTADRTVSYIRTPAGEWVTTEDGSWVRLEGEIPPATPPLNALSDSTELRLESGDAASGVLIGTLGPSAGAAQGLNFRLTITNGLVSQISYNVPTEAGEATVTTTLSDIGMAGVVAPPPGM
jgi:hypothetical protein